MKYEEFLRYYNDCNLIPVYQKFNADLHTALKIFVNFYDSGEDHFLYESVEGIGRFARYSFLGKNPLKKIYNYGNNLIIESDNSKTETEENIFDFIKRGFGDYKAPVIKDLPYFTGGLVGYFGYEDMSLIESKLNFQNKPVGDIPDSIFCLYYDIVAYDHYKHEVIIISNVYKIHTLSPEEQYNSAMENIKNNASDIFKENSNLKDFSVVGNITGDENKEEYKLSVEHAKQDIYDGEIFQVVLSNRFTARYEGDLLNVYRALRTINPSPYMYYLNFGEHVKIAGTSPEELVSVKNGTVSILPIAGTRKRGSSDAEDLELSNDLLNDPKEIAEHTMLVDLARNDLGRVCEPNTVNVTENKEIHKFSHVIHIVSKVEGALKKGLDSIDAFKAAFPAGTVSGAPKIRAMELIEKYENSRRHVYAGAVGYIDFNGNLDTCIAIRTIFSKDDELYIQAGAGIVADSVPENEWTEVLNKSAVLKRALEIAGELK